jgi:hypothetical protein
VRGLERLRIPKCPYMGKKHCEAVG